MQSLDYTFTTTTGYIISIIEDAITGTRVTAKYRGEGNISINKVSAPGAVPSNLQHLNIFINITAPETLEIEWAYIEIPYNETALNGIDEAGLRIYWWTSAEWKICNNTNVDTERNIVWANVTHLTIFAPMAEKAAEAPQAPVNWLLYIGIAAIVIILAVSLAFWKKKRKP